MLNTKTQPQTLTKIKKKKNGNEKRTVSKIESITPTEKALSHSFIEPLSQNQINLTEVEPLKILS